MLDVNRPGDRFHPSRHPIRPHSRLRDRPPRRLHHYVGHPAKEDGIGLVEVLGAVTMQLFVRDNGTMIAAPVQCNVDGISKGSHDVLLKRANELASILPARANWLRGSIRGRKSFPPGF
jgi:hypothetical protein